MATEEISPGGEQPPEQNQAVYAFAGEALSPEQLATVERMLGGLGLRRVAEVSVEGAGSTASRDTVREPRQQTNHRNGARDLDEIRKMHHALYPLIYSDGTRVQDVEKWEGLGMHEDNFMADLQQLANEDPDYLDGIIVQLIAMDSAPDQSLSVHLLNFLHRSLMEKDALRNPEAEAERWRRLVDNPDDALSTHAQETLADLMHEIYTQIRFGKDGLRPFIQQLDEVDDGNVEIEDL